MKRKSTAREVLKELPSVDSIIQGIPKTYLNIPHSLLIKNIRSTLTQI